MSGRGMPTMGFSRHDRSPDYRYRGEADYRGSRDWDSAVYKGGSHPDYAARTMGSGEGWETGSSAGYGRDRGGSSEGMIDRMGRRVHDVRDAVSGVVGAVGSVAGAVGSAASTVASGIGSAAETVASGTRAAASAAARMRGGLASAGETAAHGARVAGSTAWQGGAGAYDQASRLGSGAYDQASRLGYSAYEEASRMGYRARRTAADVLETEPLVIGALGLAVGAAIGAMLPRTDMEDRYFGETRDQLRDNAEAFAREQFERGKAVAEEAYRTARQEAEAAGLTNVDAGGLVEKVGDVARATIDRVREAATEQGLTPSALEASASGADGRNDDDDLNTGTAGTTASGTGASGTSGSTRTWDNNV